MADNQHFQYVNKLPYFKEIYGKSKLQLKAYSYTRKGHWTWSTKMAAMSFKIWLLRLLRCVIQVYSYISGITSLSVYLVSKRNKFPTIIFRIRFILGIIGYRIWGTKDFHCCMENYKTIYTSKHFFLVVMFVARGYLVSQFQDGFTVWACMDATWKGNANPFWFWDGLASLFFIGLYNHSCVNENDKATFTKRDKMTGKLRNWQNNTVCRLAAISRHEVLIIFANNLK